ncbi:MAG: TOMM precursor leader peptide-binding protein [Pseudonocardia sp.]
MSSHTASAPSPQLSTLRPSGSLPASLRPRPHHPVLHRSGSSLQFGVGPGGAVEISGLDVGLRRLLLDWHGARRVEEVLQSAVGHGLDPGTVRSVLAELWAAGALVDGADADRVAAARAEASVLVSGAGPVTAAVATTIAASGVGRLAVSTSGAVRAADVGALGAADSGRPRLAAVVDAVRRVAPDVRCETRAPRGRVDLVVLTGGWLPSPVSDAPHLSTRLVDGLGMVGPLVLPGRSACLRCIDLHHAEHDPHWPTVAADLAGRVGSASPATTAATAALAADQALAAVDALLGNGGAPPTLDAVLHLDTRRGTLCRRPWPPHPRCGCGAAHVAPLPPWAGPPSGPDAAEPAVAAAG